MFVYTIFKYFFSYYVSMCNYVHTYISVQGRSVKFSYEMCKEAVMKEII